jgi:hypothetical protein
MGFLENEESSTSRMLSPEETAQHYRDKALRKAERRERKKQTTVSPPRSNDLATMDDRMLGRNPPMNGDQYEDRNWRDSERNRREFNYLACVEVNGVVSEFSSRNSRKIPVSYKENEEGGNFHAREFAVHWIDRDGRFDEDYCYFYSKIREADEVWARNRGVPIAYTKDVYENLNISKTKIDEAGNFIARLRLILGKYEDKGKTLILWHDHRGGHEAGFIGEVINSLNRDKFSMVCSSDYGFTEAKTQHMRWTAAYPNEVCHTHPPTANNTWCARQQAARHAVWAGESDIWETATMTKSGKPPTPRGLQDLSAMTSGMIITKRADENSHTRRSESATRSKPVMEILPSRGWKSSITTDTETDEQQTPKRSVSSPRSPTYSPEPPIEQAADGYRAEMLETSRTIL